MAPVISVLDACLVGAGLYIITKLFKSRRTPPPGPSGWPLIGNLLDVPQEKNWLAFEAMGRKYGDISSISVLGTRYVILNSSRAVSEVLEKQSAKSSSRPHLTMACDLVGWSLGMSFIPYNERFKQYRRHFSRLFGTRASTSVFHATVEEEMRRLVLNVVKQPDALNAHIRRTAGSVILKVVYGYSVQEGTDPFVEMAEKAMQNVAVMASPGRYLVDLVPALRFLPEWCPGAGFWQDVKRYRQVAMDVVYKPHAFAVEQMAAGKAVPSFITTLLSGEVTPEEEDVITWTASSAYLAASDSVVGEIYAFFLAMVMYLDVQAKAQAELDSVVGTDRLPTLEDRDSLPYINAICKEVLRWHVVAPLAVPHVAAEDIYVDGYVISKGSHIIGNAWAILHDDNIYSDPSVFKPERFLGPDPQPDPQIACFGYGRRICPGLNLAEADIFMAVSLSLATLKISRKVINGVEIVPELHLTSGAMSHVKPFECEITPRSAQAMALLQC